jgi:heme-degrading monooxygenase HmoA
VVVAAARGAGYKDRVFVTVTKTRSLTDDPIEVATIAGEEMLPWLQAIEGFEGLLMVSSETEGTTLVLTFWESREVAERHRAPREKFRDRVTAAVGVRVEEVVDYELTFADLGDWAVKPAR